MLRSTTLDLRPRTVGGAFQHLWRLASRLRAEWRIRCAIGELRELGDGMLRDIGLLRTDIERCVRHGRPSCSGPEQHRDPPDRLPN